MKRGSPNRRQSGRWGSISPISAIVRPLRVILPAVTLIGLLVWGLVACEPSSVEVKDQTVPILREKVGHGRKAKAGDTVRITYRATAKGETREVMSAKDYRFELGRGAVILGIDEGVTGMRVGGERTIECRPHKHWGRDGHGDKIPPRTTLIFELKLHEIE